MTVNFIDNPLLLLVIIFFATFTQTATGFGFALVSMPFLVQILPGGLSTAAPLGVFTSMANQAVMIARYRTAFNFRAVIRLAIPALVAVPLGVLALSQIDETVILVPLGVVISGYALYALFTPRLPRLEHSAWAYGFGFLAGLLGGAYNTSGPPVVIYGNAHGWKPAEFKVNIQSFFLILNFLLIVSHAAAGNLTPPVWEASLISLPAVGLGIVAGFLLDRYMNPDLFRRVILVMLVGVGLNLIRVQLV